MKSSCAPGVCVCVSRALAQNRAQNERQCKDPCDNIMRPGPGVCSPVRAAARVFPGGRHVAPGQTRHHLAQRLGVHEGPATHEAGAQGAVARRRVRQRRCRRSGGPPRPLVAVLGCGSAASSAPTRALRAALCPLLCLLRLLGTGGGGGGGSALLGAAGGLRTQNKTKLGRGLLSSCHAPQAALKLLSAPQ